MSGPTIPARLLAEGVGDPPWWLGADGYMHREGATWEASAWKAARVDLSDLQTAFGVALKLDEWEIRRFIEAPDDGLPEAIDDVGTWVAYVHRWQFWPGLYPLQRMIARLTHIGMDHTVRRTLWPDVEVEPGTLARLDRPEGYWWFGTDMDGHRFTPDGYSCDGAWPNVPALAGITDPTAALAAIYEEVTCAR